MAKQKQPAITERDLRIPEWRDVNIADLERREDGTIARKDRWERGIRQIAGIVGIDPRQGFEVDDVVKMVREMREALTVDHKGSLYKGSL